MERVPEPELMKDDLQAQAYTNANFEEAHSSLIVLFRETFPAQEVQGVALDLGCGPGDIAMRFARAFPECSVHAVDGSDAMLKYGREALEADPELRRRVVLIRGLLPDAELPNNAYDVVLSNSLLHHLHAPEVLWDSIKRHGKQGAPVFVMDLVRPESIVEAKRMVETYAPHEPPILKRDFYNSLLAAFEVNEVRNQLLRAGLEQLTIRMVSDRHFIVAGHL